MLNGELLYSQRINLYDSLYSQGRKAYESCDYTSSKRYLIKVLEFVVSKDSTSINIRDGRSGPRLYSSKKDAYVMLKEIYYSDGDYYNALNINDSLQSYLHTLDPPIGDMVEIIGTANRTSNHDIFAAWCYFKLGDYDKSIIFSINSINNLVLEHNESYKILILSTKIKFGKGSFKKIFLTSLDSLKPIGNFPFVNHAGNLLINKYINVSLRLLNQDILFFIEDTDNIQKDLFENKISYEDAINRIKILFKEQHLYKMIMES